MAFSTSAWYCAIACSSAIFSKGEDGWDTRFYSFPEQALVGQFLRQLAPAPIEAVSIGDFLVGGRFTNLGGTEVLNLALWNGSRWVAPLPNGFGEIGIEFGNTNDYTNGIHSVASWGTEILIGGRGLTNAGGTAIGNVAHWDGFKWDDLNGGTTGFVSAVVFRGNDIFAGGKFESIGGVAATNIAQWLNGSWIPLAAGLPLIPQRLTIHERELYAKGIAASGHHQLLRWSGSEWLPLDDTFSERPWLTPGALLSRPEGLYVGGNFTNQLLRVTNIALWTGTELRALGNGLPGGVVDLAVFRGEILAAGTFRLEQTNRAGLARWDGTNWTVLTEAPIFAAHRMGVSGDRILVRGSVYTGLEESQNGAVYYDGNRWMPIGAGFEHLLRGASSARPVIHLEADQRGVTLGAGWGRDQRTQLRRWNGERWEEVHRKELRFPIEINAFGVQDDTYWIGTDVVSPAWNIPLPSELGGTDGTNWFGGISPGQILGLRVVGAKVFAGGSLGVYEWNGTQFSSSYPLYTNYVAAMATDGSELFVAGRRGPTPGHYEVSKFDGSNWIPLGGTITNKAGARFGMEFVDGTLYVFGSFVSVAGKPAWSVAKWNGRDWEGVAQTTLTNNVFAIAGDGRGGLYVGGLLTEAPSGTNLYRVKNGEVMGMTTSGPVEALEWWHGALYAAGGFTMLERTISRGIGAWHDPEAAVDIILSGPLKVTNGSLVELSLQMFNARETNLSNVRVRVPFASGAAPIGMPEGATVANSEIAWVIPEIAPGVTNSSISFRLNGGPETNFTFVAMVEVENVATYRSEPRAIILWDGNNAPAVTNTFVTHGITLPTPLKLRATAADADGTIAMVEFYNGDRLVGMDATAPYEIDWPEIGVGNVRIRAAAVDDEGKRTFSTFRVQTVSVRAPTSMVNPEITESGSVRFFILGIIGG